MLFASHIQVTYEEVCFSASGIATPLKHSPAGPEQTSACWREDVGGSQLTQRDGVCHETADETMPLVLE
jgi:hypothetical protein